MRKNPRIVELLLAKDVDDIDSGLAMAVSTQSLDLITPFLNTKKVSAKGLANAYLAAKRFNNDADR